MHFNCISVLFFSYFVLGIHSVPSDEPIVKTTSGTVRGQTIQVLNKTIDQFLGIPYAVPPLGSLRFAKPKPIEKPIEGIIDATKVGNTCLQARDKEDSDWLGNLTRSEDCLVLNIWSEKRENNSTKLKPVMFLIPGGGMSIGSIFQEFYNGSVLATYDVVFASVNYRLANFGLLYGGVESAPGNVALFDQNLGLKWVRDNIHLFGGDKNQITIFGVSAGSQSVSTHVLSPQSKGLFKRAIMESGAHLYNKNRPTISKEEALLQAKQLAKRLNCSDDKQWLECLRKVDANELIVDKFEVLFPVEGTEFLPFGAQKAFEENKFNEGLDLIAGITKNEGSSIANTLRDIFTKNYSMKDFDNFFKLIDNAFHDLSLKNITDFYFKGKNMSDSNTIKYVITEVFGDIMVKCPTYLFAKRYAERSKTNVFFYELTHSTRGPAFEMIAGITHGADIEFVMGLIQLNPKTTPEDKEFSKKVMKYWTDFAKYGKPDSNWPQLIDTKTGSSVTKTKDLNPKNSEKYFNGLFDETCDGFWKNYF